MKITKNRNNTFYASKNRKAQYSELLDNIIKQTKSDRRLKLIFFWAVLVILFLVCAGCAYVVYNVLESGNPSNIDLAACIGAFGAVIGSIITLPSIIANHLFPQNGEEIRLNFMKDIKQFDIMNQDEEDFDEISDDLGDIIDDVESDSDSEK